MDFTRPEQGVWHPPPELVLSWRGGACAGGSVDPFKGLPPQRMCDFYTARLPECDGGDALQWAARVDVPSRTPADRGGHGLATQAARPEWCASLCITDYPLTRVVCCALTG